jgi:hypothetical protein
MGYEVKPKKEEEDAFPATGDVVNAAPGPMSHQEIVEKSKQFWQGPGCPGFEGAPPAAPRPSSTVYAQPASNLRATPISAAELAAKSSSGVYRNISKPVPLELSAEPNVKSTHD